MSRNKHFVSSQKQITLLFLFWIINAYTNVFGQVSLHILGTAQDAGAPQIGCKKECCISLWDNGIQENVVSLGVIDNTIKTHYLFEATPDIGQQLALLEAETRGLTNISGIFITHGHIGHYAGLLYLGKEAMNGNNIPLFAAKRMADFLRKNGPWEQLVLNQNINIMELVPEKELKLSSNLHITPILVPHRDEYSETVGFIIKGSQKTALFIPDIDKWERWDTAIENLINQVDYAFLDATFFDGKELPNRNMDAIPHPFVVESIQRFDSLSSSEKAKIYFIHFNHTNPLLKRNSKAFQLLTEKGYQIAKTGMKFEL